MRTPNVDRLVLVFSHHGLETMTNHRPVPPQPRQQPGQQPGQPGEGRLVDGRELRAHRFGNVVDWPCQAGLHRELVGNEPWRGFQTGRAGEVADRNVELRVPVPFGLSEVTHA